MASKLSWSFTTLRFTLRFNVVLFKNTTFLQIRHNAMGLERRAYSLWTLVQTFLAKSNTFKMSLSQFANSYLLESGCAWGQSCLFCDVSYKVLHLMTPLVCMKLCKIPRSSGVYNAGFFIDVRDGHRCEEFAVDSSPTRCATCRVNKKRHCASELATGENWWEPSACWCLVQKTQQLVWPNSR